MQTSNHYSSRRKRRFHFLADKELAKLCLHFKFGPKNNNTLMSVLQASYPNAYWKLLKHTFTSIDPFIRLFTSKNPTKVKFICDSLIGQPDLMLKVYQHFKNHFKAEAQIEMSLGEGKAEYWGNAFRNLLAKIFMPAAGAYYSLLHSAILYHPAEFIILCEEIIKDHGPRYLHELLSFAGKNCLDSFFSTNPKAMHTFAAMLRAGLERTTPNRIICEAQLAAILQDLSQSYFASLHAIKPKPPLEKPTLRPVGPFYRYSRVVAK